MLDKKTRLIARAAATTRVPTPARLVETDRRQKREYRIVAVSLYKPESDWIDHLTQMLQRVGIPKANRSLVVREAILRLQEELKEKSPEEIRNNFIESQAKRNLSHSDEV